jgi:hypothetical protein
MPVFRAAISSAGQQLPIPYRRAESDNINKPNEPQAGFMKKRCRPAAFFRAIEPDSAGNRSLTTSQPGAPPWNA